MIEGYIIINCVMTRLKKLVGEISINEIDLLDISSLVNYELIQLERLMVDLS
jgi:hypothetical protein